MFIRLVPPIAVLFHLKETAYLLIKRISNIWHLIWRNLSNLTPIQWIREKQFLGNKWTSVEFSEILSACITENSKREQEPLQKTDAGSTSHSLPSGGNSHPSLCPFHLRLETQSTLQWVEDISPNRASTKHAESEKSSGLPSCSTVREHRIPLPATELGGTALVTTKTV